VLTRRIQSQEESDQRFHPALLVLIAKHDQSLWGRYNAWVILSPIIILPSLRKSTRRENVLIDNPGIVRTGRWFSAIKFSDVFWMLSNKACLILLLTKDSQEHTSLTGIDKFAPSNSLGSVFNIDIRIQRKDSYPAQE